MRSDGLELFRIAGIRVRLHSSWLFVFLLVMWSLAQGWLPMYVPERPAAQYWATSFAATLLFFLSILLHELAHALVAIRRGIPVPAITLFLFGGVSEMREEPKQPGTEVQIAIAGPIASLVLALIFGGLYTLLRADPPGLVSAVPRYLAIINAALALFNLLPGFPLDGGRVFHAIVWWRTGSLDQATRVAADAGKAVAVGLMAIGVLQLLHGNMVGGVWLLLIGVFLFGLAGTGLPQLQIRQALEQATVDDILIRDVVVVDSRATVAELIEDYFLGTGFRGFPVVEAGRLRGLVSVTEAKALSPAQRRTTRVEAIMTPLEAHHVIDRKASLGQALRRMEETQSGRLLVLRAGELAGMITRGGLMRFLELKLALD
jgi:Zn-dependent protease